MVADDPAESFGARMVRLKRERGEPGGGPGRPRIADKHGRYVSAAERAIAAQLPAEAKRYIDELEPKGPELCQLHKEVLRCPAKDCGTVSERTYYNFKAAAYLFDRIMGRPTSRSENVITVRLVEELTSAVVLAFSEVNEIGDTVARREAFAARLVELGSQFGGAAA